ncbi:DNA glycosylase [Ostreococcus tauri]|uniref:DNA glycosylase n=2 Tax=Ostreococcus tauri TaxID=70448 RepID=A0A090M3W6_OSTTA|nr:DNA glycosylase [Ostreococcus tauri]CEF98910.1 DNA glycosylase [Ostreococcus tauri]|eukprot:XP_003081003.2 DNA glycosylase [Ostreococcus tauri]
MTRDENAPPALSEYELQRLAHVERNRAYMKRLGVLQISKDMFGDANNRRSNANSRKRKTLQEPTRRSSRVVGIKPEHDGSAIDAMDDGDEPGENSRRQPKLARDEDEETDAFAASREWLAGARERLLETRAASGKTNESAWRADAVRRWGEDVPSHVDDWETWVKSRLGKPPPPSELQLLQEYYAHDAWMLLIACALMSRVASGPLKHEVISNFFEKFPTPTAALHADAEEVFEVIKRLGLFPGRHRTIVEVSTAILTNTGAFEVGLEPEKKIYGIGEFGIDSFEIFARGDINRKPKDCNLAAFCSWQRRHGGAKEEIEEKPTVVSVKKERSD